MAGVLPNVSGGLSPNALMAAYNNQQAQLAPALAKLSTDANIARQEAITADSEIAERLMTAGIENLPDVAGVIGGSNAVNVLLGDALLNAYRGQNIGPSQPLPIDLGFAAQTDANALAAQRAATIKDVGAGAADLLAGNLQLPSDVAASAGVPAPQVLPAQDAFNTRFSQGGGVIAYTRDGTAVNIDPETFARLSHTGAVTSIPPNQQASAAQAGGPAPVSTTGTQPMDASEFAGAPSVEEVMTPQQPTAQPQQSTEAQTLLDRARFLDPTVDVQLNPDGTYTITARDGRSGIVTFEQLASKVAEMEGAASAP